MFALVYAQSNGPARHAGRSSPLLKNTRSRTKNGQLSVRYAQRAFTDSGNFRLNENNDNNSDGFAYVKRGVRKSRWTDANGESLVVTTLVARRLAVGARITVAVDVRETVRLRADVLNANDDGSEWLMGGWSLVGRVRSSKRSPYKLLLHFFGERTKRLRADDLRADQ